MLKVFLVLSDLNITDLSSYLTKSRVLCLGFADLIGNACELFHSSWEMLCFRVRCRMQRRREGGVIVEVQVYWGGSWGAKYRLGEGHPSGEEA